MGRIIIAIGLAVGAGACAAEAHFDPTPPPPRTRSATNPRALRVPTILAGDPSGSYVDLGPISTPTKRPLTQDALALEADRYGADAFILETESLDRRYGSAERSASLFPPLGGEVGLVLLPIIVAIQVANGQLFKKPASTEYYRAIRYLDPDSIRKIILDPIELEIPEDIWRYLDKGQDIREQFARLNALYVEGRIAPSLYERVRLHMCRS